MKTTKTNRAKKSFGTLAVQKYRPRMNKFTRTQRDRLLERAMQIAYGIDTKTAAGRR